MSRSFREQFNKLKRDTSCNNHKIITVKASSPILLDKSNPCIPVIGIKKFVAGDKIKITETDDSIIWENTYTALEQLLAGSDNVHIEVDPQDPTIATITVDKYDDTEIKNKLTALENKTDVYIKDVKVTRQNNNVILTYTKTDNSEISATFEDKDTITLAYDDTVLRERIKALEDKPDKDTVYDDTDIKQRLDNLENNTNTTYNIGSWS